MKKCAHPWHVIQCCILGEKHQKVTCNTCACLAIILPMKYCTSKVKHNIAKAYWITASCSHLQNTNTQKLAGQCNLQEVGCWLVLLESIRWRPSADRRKVVAKHLSFAYPRLCQRVSCQNFYWPSVFHDLTQKATRSVRICALKSGYSFTAFVETVLVSTCLTSHRMFDRV